METFEDQEPSTLVIPSITLLEPISESDDSDTEEENEHTTQPLESNNNQTLDASIPAMDTQLPTPEPSQASEASSTTPSATGKRLGKLLPAQYDTEPHPAVDSSNKAPNTDKISAYITPHAIIQGKRTRPSRKESYITILNQAVDSNCLFRTAFATSFLIKLPEVQATLSRDQLPPEPRNYKELLTHPFKDYFMKAIQVELNKM